MNLKAEDFQKPDMVIQLGVQPVRIDILTSITGLTWEEANLEKVVGKYGDINVCFIGKSQLIANKKALNRKKDQADLEALGA